ncbi:MAG: SCO1/SenC [Candidatus Accumulibacter regalis]|uniref:SCO1/SenC n=1 Tax=Accumulibacter regalis TaxID=522306 RepID=A0A011QY37_ACCRE|nr:MAG: SCO1/SenC [Candidatus Accumulibacter regalis]
MRSRLPLIALIVVLSATLVFVTAFWDPRPPATVMAVQNARLAAAKPAGGDFMLQGPQGPVALADYRGKVVLLYFGYTYCPDVCPTALALIAQALSGLEASEQPQVQALFISVDPQRDSADRLQEYAPYFHPKLIGLSGTQDEIASVAARYGARYEAQSPNERSAVAE